MSKVAHTHTPEEKTKPEKIEATHHNRGNKN